MSYKYPVYQPDLTGNEKEYVNRCLDSTWISSKGEFITEFEKKFSDYTGLKYSAAVCNGTVAVHLALLTLGIGASDEVIVPSFTYIASVNAITYTGARPVFADSLENTLQLDPDDAEKRITKKTKAIMAVHLYGHPCEMSKIMKIAQENNLYVIEDCAESLGSKYKDKQTGTFGDIAAFSFFGNKTITTGEGGMVATNNKTLIDRAIHFKGQGLAKDREYWHDVVGYNYRMTNICAAIGSAQIERIDDIIKKKREIAQWYSNGLKSLPLRLLWEEGNVYNTFWMCTIILESQDERELLREHLNENGIETRPAFYPVHTMPMYTEKYYKLPVAEDISWRGINLPSYPALAKEDVDNICRKIVEFYKTV